MYPAVIPLADSMAPAVVGACRRNTGKTMRVLGDGKSVTEGSGTLAKDIIMRGYIKSSTR